MLRSPLRSFARQPALSVTIVATLAVGVGVATALFLYLDLFLHPRLAAPAAERVVEVYFGTADEPRQPASALELQRLREHPLLHDAIGVSAIGAALGAPGGSRFAWGQFVSGGTFEFFGAHPGLGRLLEPRDDAPGAAPVVVLGYGEWQSDFGGDPAVVGRALPVNGRMLTVVGVTEPSFVGLGYATGFFVPLAQSDAVGGVSRLSSPEERWLRVVARLPEGTSPAAARGALTILAGELDRAMPLEGGARRTTLLRSTGFDPESSNDPFFHAARALTAAAILFLLLGSANVAGLLLARAAAREREWALRKALGASPRRLALAVAADLALPALLGALASLAVAGAVARWLESMLLTPVGGIGPGWTAPGQHLLALDARAVGFALAAAACTTFAALLPPLVRVLRDDPNRALRTGDARSGARLGGRRLLVAAELALALALLVGGGLLARSLYSVAHGDLGFDSRGLVQATVFMPRAAGPQGAAAAWSAILDGTRRLPAVTHATLVHVAPNSGMSRAARIAAVETPDALRDVDYNIVAPEYFATLGVPLLAGRALDERDAPRAPAAVVVNRALATRLFGTAPAVGRRVRIAGPVRPGEAGPDFEIVGVAEDAATTSAIAPHRPTVYFALGQRSHARLTLVARTALPLATFEPTLRAALQQAAPESAIVDLAECDEQLQRSLHPLRINATLAVGLAALSLVTAVAGLLALQLFGVSLRRREFGVRQALGAQKRQIARLVLLDSLRLALLGTTAGIAGALAATRFLRSLLFGVGPLDPAIFLLLPLGLLLVVFLAAWIPAGRAMGAEPAEALRAL